MVELGLSPPMFHSIGFMFSSVGSISTCFQSRWLSTFTVCSFLWVLSLLPFCSVGSVSTFVLFCWLNLHLCSVLLALTPLMFCSADSISAYVLFCWLFLHFCSVLLALSPIMFCSVSSVSSPLTLPRRKSHKIQLFGARKSLSRYKNFIPHYYET
jgi:hypothetical protein